MKPAAHDQTLGPGIRQFVEDMGLSYEEEGFPRMAGRLLGWLLVCEPEHQTAQETAERLGASAGSISTATRILLQAGLVEKIGVPGQRRAAYRIRADGWSERIRVHLRRNRQMRRLAEAGLALTEDRPAASRRRLEEWRDFQAFLESELPDLLERWKAKRKRSR